MGYMPYVAIAIALVAVVVGYVITRRMAEAESRSYIDELDDHTYDVDLDTPQRRDYFTLLEAEQEGKVSPNALMVALLNRAAAVLPSVEVLERDRPRLHKLHRHSYVPANVLDELAATEFALQQEVEEVRAEAERLRPGWGKEVFQQAWQIARKRKAEAAAAAQAAQSHATKAGSWSQSGTHMSLGLPLPLGVTAEHVQVVFEAQTCVVIVGTHSPRRLMLEQPIKPADCSWSVRDDDSTLTIVLAKATPGLWKAPHKTG